MAILRFPIDISYSGAGGPGVNVFHGRAGGLAATIASQAQDLANVLHTFYVSLAAGTATGGIYHDGTTLSLGTVIDVETSEEYSPSFTAINGTISTSQAPPVIQLVAGWRTSIAARRGMGRTFLGPVTNSTVEANGTVNPTVLAHVNTAIDTLVSDSQGVNDAALGVWGLQTKGGTPEDPHVLRDFIGGNLRDQFSVLRSRRD